MRSEGIDGGDVIVRVNGGGEEKKDEDLRTAVVILGLFSFSDTVVVLRVRTVVVLGYGFSVQGRRF